MNRSISYPRGGGGSGNYQKIAALLEALGYSGGGADIEVDPEATTLAKNQYTSNIASQDPTPWIDKGFDARNIDTTMVNRFKPSSGFNNFLTGGAGSKAAAAANIENQGLLTDMAKAKDMTLFNNAEAINQAQRMIPVDVAKFTALTGPTVERERQSGIVANDNAFNQSTRMFPLEKQKAEALKLIEKFGAMPSEDVVENFRNTNIPAQSDALLTGSLADSAKNLLTKDLATRDVGINDLTKGSITDAAVADAAAKKILAEGTLAQAPRQVDLNKSNLETGFVKNFNEATLGGLKTAGNNRLFFADPYTGVTKLVGLPDEQKNISKAMLGLPLDTITEQPFGQPTDPLGNPLDTKASKDILGVSAPAAPTAAINYNRPLSSFTEPMVNTPITDAPLSNFIETPLFGDSYEHNAPLSSRPSPVVSSRGSKNGMIAPFKAPVSGRTGNMPAPAENISPEVNPETKNFIEKYVEWMNQPANKNKSFSEYLADFGFWLTK